MDVDNDAGVNGGDPAGKLDFEELCRISKWPNLDVYLDYFGRHPTWGLFSAKETVGGDDNDDSGTGRLSFCPFLSVCPSVRPSVSPALIFYCHKLS